jgi:dTDP-4-dehydrorhamnose reductase
MKVVLIGANGQLGTDLHRVLQNRGVTVIPTTHRELDIRDAAQVSEAVAKTQPDVVVNTAAFHKVEECETRPALAFEVNALAARNLAQTCSRAGCALVHFSTDYVFGGKQREPYSEEDLPHPLSVYGASKLAGEHLIAAACERHLIIRTCGLYGVAGSSGKGGNFVETMLKKAAQGVPIKVVNDQVLTPTFTADLAETVCQLIQMKAFGLYHVTAEGQCSWYEFARAIFELEKLTVDLTPVSTAEFPSPVARPAYSVLSKQKLRSLGLSMPPWQEGLVRYLSARRSKPQPNAMPD